ncbi:MULTISPECIES: DUF3945 domain-containing protein [Hymenobacter]|uniref:DUF3945 domain-containing protein n=1 Tax=Hymenobacter mucosus TaxID=1411120 RepID=A0A239AW05_9BACT|nr:MULTISPECIES: DUF3945 domain-containing protein [Hymenobacter]MDF7815505.1 DUF3945 domain-containing protein [Hymenobacter sp. YC55]SNR99906.1 Protein of unknown function [Hymenobacter mucosus]
MAEQEVVSTPEAVAPTPAAPQVIYLNGLPNPKGEIDPTLLSNTQAAYSLFQLKVDPNNPNRAEATHLPGADAQLINGYHATMRPMFHLNGAPTSGEEFVHTNKPAIFERQGESWKMTEQGRASFAYRPQGPEGANYRVSIPEYQPIQDAPTTQAPNNTDSAAGELQIRWRQQDKEVAPMLELRAYVAQLDKAGIAVGAMSFGQQPDGKLSSSFDVTYDPKSPLLLQLESTLQAIHQVKNGVEVVEKYDQTVNRWNSLSPDDQQKVMPGAAQVVDAFNSKQWERMNARLTTVPSENLTGPEQAQQSAAAVRVEQVTQYQGVSREQLIQEAPNVSPLPTTAAQAQQSQLTAQAAELASEVATTTGATRNAAEAKLETVADQAMNGPSTSKAEKADALRDEAVTKLGVGEQQPAPKVAAAPAEAEQQSAAGELQIKWKQQGEGVAPLLEMRAYLDQLKDSGVAVGPMKFDRGADGKLSGSFGVSYDPASPDLAKLEGTIQGLKRVGNGVEVVDTPEQVAARRRSIGVDGQDQATDLGYSVKEAFGVKQWDALSAQLSQAPKQALTGPEQVQQEAGIERVGQVAKQRGITKEEVIQEGKSLLDIDTSGNPVSAFLKNFYAQLNGAPKTRQSLEVDYDKTRQELQQRLTRLAGNATPSDQLKQGTRAEQVIPAPAVVTPAATSPSVAAPAAAPTQQPTVPARAPKFTEADIPQKVLATMGLTVADLKASGQMEKLLKGEKTDLLAMQASGKEGQEPVKFDAKMVLHREANGSATLKMELPKRQLEIPNEIGGQPFTPEQRKQLETEGTAGLVRGLKDEKGNTYNGYVGIDKEMNKVVVLPENKVSIKDTIAGVKLTPEQSKDLREGKAVALSNMARGDGGKPYDGTAQIVASKASIVVKPTPEQPMQKQTTEVAQSTTKTVKTEVPTVEAPKPKVRGPRL